MRILIEVTVEEIVDSTSVVKQMMNMAMKSRVAYQIARLARELENELKTFENERMKLIQKYGEKDENGDLKTDENGQYTIPKDNIKEFGDESNELLETKVELNVNKIKLEDLDCELNPGQILRIMPFVEEE